MNTDDILTRIVETRKKLRLSRKQVAEMLGLTPQAYWGIEVGNIGLTIRRLIEIAQALDVSPQYLFNGDTEKVTRLTMPVPMISENVNEAFRKFYDALAGDSLTLKKVVVRNKSQETTYVFTEHSLKTIKKIKYQA